GHLAALQAQELLFLLAHEVVGLVAVVEAIEVADRVARRMVVVAVVLAGQLGRRGIPHLDEVLPVLQAAKWVLGFATTVHWPSLSVQASTMPRVLGAVALRYVLP